MLRKIRAAVSQNVFYSRGQSHFLPQMDFIYSGAQNVANQILQELDLIYGWTAELANKEKYSQLTIRDGFFHRGLLAEIIEEAINFQLYKQTSDEQKILIQFILICALQDSIERVKDIVAFKVEDASEYAYVSLTYTTRRSVRAVTISYPATLFKDKVELRCELQPALDCINRVLHGDLNAGLAFATARPVAASKTEATAKWYGDFMTRNKNNRNLAFLMAAYFDALANGNTTQVDVIGHYYDFMQQTGLYDCTYLSALARQHARRLTDFLMTDDLRGLEGAQHIERWLKAQRRLFQMDVDVIEQQIQGAEQAGTKERVSELKILRKCIEIILQHPEQQLLSEPLSKLAKFDPITGADIEFYLPIKAILDDYKKRLLEIFLAIRNQASKNSTLSEASRILATLNAVEKEPLDTLLWKLVSMQAGLSGALREHKKSEEEFLRACLNKLNDLSVTQAPAKKAEAKFQAMQSLNTINSGLSEQTYAKIYTELTQSAVQTSESTKSVEPQKTTLVKKTEEAPEGILIDLGYLPAVPTTDPRYITPSQFPQTPIREPGYASESPFVTFSSQRQAATDDGQELQMLGYRGKR